MSKATATAAMLQEKLNHYWLTEPEDVVKLRKGGVLGAYYHPSTAVLYAESETREMVDYLWYMLKIIEQDKLDYCAGKVAVCTMVDLKQDKWIRWYGMEALPPIMKEAVLGMQSAESKAEFLAILEILQILIGKINFWLDRVIPWMTVASVLDWTLEGK